MNRLGQQIAQIALQNDESFRRIGSLAQATTEALQRPVVRALLRFRPMEPLQQGVLKDVLKMVSENDQAIRNVLTVAGGLPSDWASAYPPASSGTAVLNLSEGPQPANVPTRQPGEGLLSLVLLMLALLLSPLTDSEKRSVLALLLTALGRQSRLPNGTIFNHLESRRRLEPF